MTEKELKRLHRADLLELLLEQSRENERLRCELEQARAQLEDRAIRIENAGSLAEAALSLSNLFVSAQVACDLYRENIRQRGQQEQEHLNNIRSQLEKKCSACPTWKAIFGEEQSE